jgi:hypothetical protein
MTEVVHLSVGRQSAHSGPKEETLVGAESVRGFELDRGVRRSLRDCRLPQPKHGSTRRESEIRVNRAPDDHGNVVVGGQCRGDGAAECVGSHERAVDE